MKIFWIWFKNTRYWEEELCVTILAENENQAFDKLFSWKKEQEEEDPDIFEDVSFNIDNLNIRVREDVELPLLLSTTWD
jgi:hypothetical protein